MKNTNINIKLIDTILVLETIYINNFGKRIQKYEKLVFPFLIIFQESRRVLEV